MLSLRETSRDIYEDCWTDRVQVGDIVLISTPNKTRVSWPIGRVTQLLTGTDGKTRCAKVKRGNSTDVCSINHLYPLELSLLTEKRVESREQPKLAAKRPQRKAALTYKLKLKNLHN